MKAQTIGSIANERGQFDERGSLMELIERAGTELQSAIKSATDWKQKVTTAEFGTVTKVEAFDEPDELAQVMKKQADVSLENMPESLKEMERLVFPLRPCNLLALDKLRKVIEPLDKDSIKSEGVELDQEAYESSLPDLTQLVDDITQDKDHGLVLTMGKGVGKTTMAVAIFMKLVGRGYPVHRTTTDPAAHLTHFLGDSDV